MKKILTLCGIMCVLLGSICGFLWWQSLAHEHTIAVIAVSHPPQSVDSPQEETLASPEELTRTSATISIARPTDVFVEPETQLLVDAPFTSQAPRAQWSDPLFQDGCEEASLLMAARYFRGDYSETIAPDDATNAITTLSHYARDTYGFYLDIAAADVARLANDFYDHINATYAEKITRETLIAALQDGALIILPMNGRALGNPNFTNGGPERHALLVIGYNPLTKEFITNDPGTRNGRHYRYATDVLLGAIRDYPSGNHEPFDLHASSEMLRHGVIITLKK